MLENPHEVDAECWRLWPQTSRKLFNHVYDYMFNNPDLFSHPQAAEVPIEHWKTTCWNAAWEAASQFKEILETSRPIHSSVVFETPGNIRNISHENEGSESLHQRRIPS